MVPGGLIDPEIFSPAAGGLFTKKHNRFLHLLGAGPWYTSYTGAVWVARRGAAPGRCAVKILDTAAAAASQRGAGHEARARRGGPAALARRGGPLARRGPAGKRKRSTCSTTRT